MHSLCITALRANSPVHVSEMSFNLTMKLSFMATQEHKNTTRRGRRLFRCHCHRICSTRHNIAVWFMQMGKAKPFPNTRKPCFCNTYIRNWLSNPEETYEFSFPFKCTDTQVKPTILANLEEQPYEKERRERDVLREGHALLVPRTG